MEFPLKYAPLAPDIWNKLAAIPRTGWVRRNVSNPESVQEHILHARIIASNLTSLTLQEKEEVINMLEIHDWPEVETGDIVIYTYNEQERRKLKLNKFEKEKEVMSNICSNLDEIGKEIFNLWLHLETSNSSLAKFSKEIDKYQAIEKALEYEKTQGIICFKEFLDYNGQFISHPELLEKLKNLSTGHEKK